MGRVKKWIRQGLDKSRVGRVKGVNSQGWDTSRVRKVKGWISKVVKSQGLAKSRVKKLGIEFKKYKYISSPQIVCCRV